MRRLSLLKKTLVQSTFCAWARIPMILKSVAEAPCCS